MGLVCDRMQVRKVLTYEGPCRPATLPLLPVLLLTASVPVLVTAVKLLVCCCPGCGVQGVLDVAQVQARPRLVDSSK